MTRVATLALVVALGATVVPVARAQDPRPSAFHIGFYQPGVVNPRDYATPPAGFYILDYNVWNKPDGFRDRNGDRVSQLDLTQLDPSLGTLDVDVSANAYVNALVFAYVSRKIKALGDARYIVAVAPVFATADARVSLFAPDGTNAARVEGGIGGFGDMAFIPLALAWSFDGRYDLSFFYTFYAPTGRYETGAADNVGVGYWGHQFQIPFYVYLFEQATALVLIPTFEVNTKVRGSDLRAGSRATIEYGVSQYFTPWLELILMNAHSFQIEDDQGSDVWWRDTPLDGRDRKFTFTVGVGAWPWKERLYVSFKYARDYAVRRRFLNNTFTLTLAFVTGLLGDPE